jgi:hypothetical protein
MKIIGYLRSGSEFRIATSPTAEAASTFILVGDDTLHLTRRASDLLAFPG